jgi:transcriptional/translational regulatory protein YebC/TACO1
VDVFAAVQDALQKAGITPVSAEIAMVPKASIDVDGETGKRIIKFMEVLDDHEDVSNVLSNANLTEEMMAE